MRQRRGERQRVSGRGKDEERGSENRYGSKNSDLRGRQEIKRDLKRREEGEWGERRGRRVGGAKRGQDRRNKNVEKIVRERVLRRAGRGDGTEKKGDRQE